MNQYLPAVNSVKNINPRIVALVGVVFAAALIREIVTLQMVISKLNREVKGKGEIIERLNKSNATQDNKKSEADASLKTENIDLRKTNEMLEKSKDKILRESKDRESKLISENQDLKRRIELQTEESIKKVEENASLKSEVSSISEKIVKLSAVHKKLG